MLHEATIDRFTPSHRPEPDFEASPALFPDLFDEHARQDFPCHVISIETIGRRRNHPREEKKIIGESA